MIPLGGVAGELLAWGFGVQSPGGSASSAAHAGQPQGSGLVTRAGEEPGTDRMGGVFFATLTLTFCG